MVLDQPPPFGRRVVTAPLPALSEADRAWQAATGWVPPAQVWRQWAVDAASGVGWLLWQPVRAAYWVLQSADRTVAAVALGVPAVAVLRWLPHVTWTGWAGLRTGLVALAVMALFALVMSAPRPSALVAGGYAGDTSGRGTRRSATFNSAAGCACGRSGGNLNRSEVVEHERAHQRALRRAGGGGSSRRVWRNKNGTWSGRVRPHSTARCNRLPAAHRIAVYRAGRAAAPGTNGDWDDDQAAAVLAAEPRRERARIDAEADRLVQRWAA